MFTQPFHDFQYHNACLSEGKALPIVVEDFFQTPHQARDNKDFPRLMRQSDARLRLACPLFARRGGAPHERGAGGGSDPGILTAGAAAGRVSRFTSQFTVNPPLGVAPSTVIPSGRVSSWLKPRNCSLRNSQLPAASVQITAPLYPTESNAFFTSKKNGRGGIRGIALRLR